MVLWAVFEKLHSRSQTKKVRPLLYVNYPPFNSFSTPRTQIGHREDHHRAFFAAEIEKESCLKAKVVLCLNGVRFKIRGQISVLLGVGWYSKVVLLFLFDFGKTAGCCFFAIRFKPARRQKKVLWLGLKKSMFPAASRKSKTTFVLQPPPW